MVKPVPMVKIVEPASADKFWRAVGGLAVRRFALVRSLIPSGQQDKPVDSRA